MKKVILVLQSRTTGRFLINCRNGEWNWASSRFWDPDKAAMFDALHDVDHILETPIDHEDMSIEILGGTSDHLFHVWIDGEPEVKQNAEWVSAFMFPEKCNRDIDRVFLNPFFQEITVRSNC